MSAQITFEAPTAPVQAAGRGRPNEYAALSEAAQSKPGHWARTARPVKESTAKTKTNAIRNGKDDLFPGTWDAAYQAEGEGFVIFVKFEAPAPAKKTPAKRPSRAKTAKTDEAPKES